MKLLVATLFLSGVLSAPFSTVSRPSTRNCDTTHFHTRKSLLYSYVGETITGLVGTSGDLSGLKLSAKCKITPVLPCTYMLQILEAELLEGQGKKQNALDFKLSSGSKDLSRELKARDLYFESEDGVIQNIQSAPGEPVHVLNMKRGILSSLQLKLVKTDQNLTEVDVNGECNVDYKVQARHPSGRVRTVLKTKDLTLCKDRAETNLGIPVTPYATEKPFSLLKSNSMCKFTMNPLQRIEGVSCEETHLFRPFSAGYNSSSGAMTTVRQNLRYLGVNSVNNVNPSMPATKQTTLKFEHTEDPTKLTKSSKEVAGILDKLGAEEGAKPDTARLFTRLIFAVRRLNKKGLKYVWYQHYECLERGRCTKEQSERYQKYIVDALSQCGTLDCANFMVATIADKKVGTPQSVQFLTGIALVGEPSESMVGNILSFCKRTSSRTAFLTLGTLMHKYCSQHSCHNLNSRSLIYQADKFLEQRLGESCQTSTTEEIEPVTLALKAIGNAGRPSTAIDKILKCAVQPGPSVINIDAIQALRRMPCSDEITEGLRGIFEDLNMDTEVRIETYLALIRCPSKKVVLKIADVLDAEKNNQVGSFVWSHLTNALESTEPVYGIPLRNAISDALQGRKLRTYQRDPLRFSRAYEGSYYNKKYEAGGSSQAQVVFHPGSYFPRSAKLNFTVDVLGASVNLLETAARFEGFETLIEQMFGPEGYFPDDRLMKLLKIKPTEAVSRDKRSAGEDEMNEIKTNLEKLQDKMQIERKNPTGALSLKLFGHEIQFMSFEDIDWLQGEADTINVIDTLINLARGGKVTYTKSFMFLEADHEIPTGLGIPLKLAVNGSGVGSVTLKGKFDIRDMFWGKKKLDVRGFITPSATIDISGKMTLDAVHASSGVHVNASLYTSTEINGNVTYKEGEGIKLSVEPPTKPVYIVNVKSNLATLLNEKRQKISGTPRKFEHKSCANLAGFLGVNLCGHVSLPMAYRDYDSPYFPLSGDSSFGMSFHTINPRLARFEVETRTLRSEDENRFDWIFNVHVPGLTFGRKVVGNSTFQFLEDGKYLSISWGIQDYRFGKFEAKYNNVSNRLQTKFSTPRMAYLRPIIVETEIFNTRNNVTNSQDIGIAINASYNNYTITDVLSFHKYKDQYKVNSKLTYWPKKHITTEARFSIKKKMMYVKIDDSSTTNRFYFAGKLAKTANRFIAKFGNDLMKKEIKIDGELNTQNKKVLVNMIVKPSGHIVEFVAYPRRNALEDGYYMQLSHLNSSTHLKGHLYSSNMKTESTLKLDGVLMKKSFLIRASHYVLGRGKKVELVAEGFGNNASISFEYSAKRWASRNVEFSAALNNKSIKTGLYLKENGIGAYLNDKTMEVETSYRNAEKNKRLMILLQMYDKPQNKKKITLNCEYAKNDDETTLSFSVDGSGYDNRLKRAVFTTGVFRYEGEKGLRVYANVLNKDFEAKWSVFTDKPGVRFVAKCMKKKLTLQSTWMASDILKEWRIDTTYDQRTISLVSTYRPKDKYLCSEIAGLSVERLDACLQLINNENEKSLRLVSQAVGQTAEMKVGLILNTEEKGAMLQISYNRVEVSDFFVGLVTVPEYIGLRVKGVIKGKRVEALLKYKPVKRSLDLDLILQGKLVTFESMLVRETNLHGVQFFMNSETEKLVTLFALVRKKPSSNVFKIGGTVKQYGAEYKLSLSKSTVEKTLSSMIIFRANSTHYKYGYSISHKSLGTNGQPNYLITTKLHYAKDKILTSIYQLINSKENLNLISKMELAPGQILTNKIAYQKQNRVLFIKYELLPGIGMTYLASLIDNDEFMGIESNLTIMDLQPLNSFALLNKKSGLLRCKLTYWPVIPPIEFTTYFRRDDGIDLGLTLSALAHVWNTTILMSNSMKQLQLKFDILPNIPIQIFAKMFEKKQFVLNVTTCSAFSAELAGTALTDEEYQLVLKHKFLETMFEDLKLSISSLYPLNKLRLRWESKAGKELVQNFNVTMQKLLNGSLESLRMFSESTRKLANDTVNYLRNNGQEKLLSAVNTSREKIKFLTEVLRNIELNYTIRKYSTRAAEVLTKLRGDLLQLVDDMKMYGAPMIDTVKYIKKTVNEISSELSPYIKPFTQDLKQWLSRTFMRYMAVSICGTTVEEIVDMVVEKVQYYYVLANDTIQKNFKLCTKVCREMKFVLNEVKKLAEKAKTTVEDLTCNYNLECTKLNVEKELKKLADRLSQREMKHILQRFNNIMKRVTLKYKEMNDYVLLTVKENKLQERAMKVLQPIINFLENATRTLTMQVRPLREKCEDFMKKSNMMVYYNKMKEQYKVVLVHTMNATEIAKTYLLHTISETNTSLVTAKANMLIMYQKVVKLIHKLKDMSWKDLQVLARNEIELNVEKLKERLIALNRTIMDRIESSVIIKSVYTTYEDVITGRMTVRDAREKLNGLLRKMIAYLEEQKLQAMDKMKALKLEEAVAKTYKSAVELYQKSSHDLKDKITTLYPKVIEELNNLVIKVKKLVMRYTELAKVKAIELRDRQTLYLNETMKYLLEKRENLVKEVHELLGKYKSYSIEFINNLKTQIIELKERYEERIKEMVIEYKFKDKMIDWVEKVKGEINNTLILYHDMPIEDIYLNLKLNASEAFDELLGFILGETLVPYEKAMERLREIKQFYQRNKQVAAAKLNDIIVLAEEFSNRYRLMVAKNYKKASDYYRNNIQPISVEYFMALKDLGRDVMFVSSVRLEQLKLWYEHVRYLKFKELYSKVNDHLANYNFNLMECCKKKFELLMDIKGKIEDFVKEFRQESKLVIERIEQVNEDVKQDAIKTFGGYEKIVRDVALKHKTEALKKLAPVNNKYKKMIILLKEYYKKTELFLKRQLQEIKDLDQDEIIDMITASLKRYPFLMEVKNYYELIRKGHMLQQIYQSLNRFPFLFEVRTHKLWPLLKKEVLEHEFVTGTHELGKVTVKKLNELSIDLYTRSLPKIHELKGKTYEEFEQLKDGLLAKNENIKKEIGEKRKEIYLKLRVTREKLLSKGERLVEGARNLFESGNEKLQEIVERVGEVSIHDIETAAGQYLRSLLVPLENAYGDLSKTVVAELLILDKHNRELQEQVHRLRKYLTNLADDIKNQYEDVATKVNEWKSPALAIGKSELKKLEKLSVKVLGHLKDYTSRGMAFGHTFIDEYIQYKELLKMTPKQLMERLQAIDLEAEKMFKTVKTITERYIEYSLDMFEQLKNSVDPEKLKEMTEKAETLLNNTRDQLDFLAVEIMETTVFLTKFYGSSSTVYSAHPEMVQFAENQLQRFLNCSRICKAKAIKFYYDARDIMERLFTQANNTYHNELPQLLKYIRTEINDLDTENLDKLQRIANKYLNISKEYVEVTLAFSKAKLLEYLKSKRSEITLELNEAKEKLLTFLKNEVHPKIDEAYKKLLVVFEQVNELLENRYREILVYSRELNKKCRTYMTKYGDIVTDLPVLAKNAMGRLPLILGMMRRDLESMMSDCDSKLREGKLYVQDEVFPKVKQTYVEIMNDINTQLAQLKETATDVMNSLNKNLKEELPIVKEKVLNIIELVRKTEIALVSGEIEFKLPSLDELKAALLDLNKLMTTKYKVICTRINGLYQNTKNSYKLISQRMRKDAEKAMAYLQENISNFCQQKITELRKLAEPRLKSLSRSTEMAVNELKRMQKEAQDFCKEKRLMFHNMMGEAEKMVREYIKMLFERGEDILEKMKRHVSELRQETKLKIEKLQGGAMQMKEDLQQSVSENRKEFINKMEALFNSIKIRKLINKYIDVEDLKNKTNEIKEDILNTSLVNDLVKMGESCYMEGRRLVYLARESSDFALYLIKHIVKYSDVWEIVDELTNPFHWIPPKNSIAMIFGKPHVYTYDGKSYQFVGYKKPSCTYVLAHDFRDNNFTLMSQETALIVNTKSGFIKIHASGKVEATVSKDADGKRVKTTHTELPVEMMQMAVRREGSFIKIKHETGLDVVCDIKHFLCTFNIDKFYHGKLAGLLGTNNNEQYDEFLKPDKTIASSVAEFANAWEVSGDPECKVNVGQLSKPTCEKKPSQRCEELFVSSSSPLALYFKFVDPKPFYEACLFDTSDCKNNISPSKSFCNVTAAYTALLREKGIWARQLDECVSCGSKGMWQGWTERGNKNVDVVLLVPETVNMKIHADHLPNLLEELKHDLSKYKPRYAVVGFGGKTAVYRHPHIVTGGGKIFGGIKDVQSAIAHMKFTAGAANAFEAIEYVGQLPFRPGASKVVIMITDQNREAISSAPLEKAMKDLDMQGVIFNVIGPYFTKKQHREVLGMSRGQVMVRKGKLQDKSKIGLPSNDYTRLAESSQGAIFNLKAYSKAHGAWTSLLKQAMRKTIVKQIDEDQTFCRQCICVARLMVEPVTICRVNRHSRCS